MKLSFKPTVPAEDSLVFDACYEPELAMTLEDKIDLLKVSICAFMFVDGKLAGETFGALLEDLGEEIEDCAGEPDTSVYCYSTTVLPQFRGHGLAKILKSFWLGEVGFANPIIGHSTSPSMKHINELFGAVHSVKHDNWYGTNRTAWFYRIKQ